MSTILRIVVVVSFLNVLPTSFAYPQSQQQHTRRQSDNSLVHYQRIEDTATIKLLFLAPILLRDNNLVHQCKSTIQEVKGRLLRKYNVKLDAESFDMAVALAAASDNALDCPEILNITASEKLKPTSSQIDIGLNMIDSIDRFYQLVKWPERIKLPAASFKSAGITFNCESQTVSFSDGTVASLDKREYRFANKVWSAVRK